MIHQDKIIDNIDLTLSNLHDFTKTNIIIGEEGSGRKTLVGYIANNLSIDIVDITETISLETINSIYLSTEKHAYVIDANKLTEKEQNTILKFIEEPPVSAYIFIVCENETDVLPTIYNRCNVIHLHPYTTEELKDICKFYGVNAEDELLRIFRTPGKLLRISKLQNLDSYKMASQKVVQSIKRASYVNALKLTSWFVPGKNNKEPTFDINIFIQFMKYYINEHVKKGNNEYYNFISVLLKYEKDLNNKYYNKKFLLDRLFYDLRGSFTNDTTTSKTDNTSETRTS